MRLVSNAINIYQLNLPRNAINQFSISLHYKSNYIKQSEFWGELRRELNLVASLFFPSICIYSVQ